MFLVKNGFPRPGTAALHATQRWDVDAFSVKILMCLFLKSSDSAVPSHRAQGKDTWQVTHAADERSLPIPAVLALATDAAIFLWSVWRWEQKHGTTGCAWTALFPVQVGKTVTI